MSFLGRRRRRIKRPRGRPWQHTPCSQPWWPDWSGRAEHLVLFELIATLCAGLFAGAAIYITLVEHPARLECGTELAATEFGPSYRRATLMQASLAAVGLAAAL